MKEEEKLARDVYSVLSQKWGSSVFTNISVAESNHLNAILLLLTSYGSTETSIGEAGIFADAAVQKLYNDLVAKASVSLEEAYKTGALIEEIDIKDLLEALSSTTNENITLVFENLLKGSRNHLRAFNLQLTTLGIVYTPVYISETDYNLIVTSPMEKGKQYKMQGKGNGQGNGNGKGQKGQGNKGNGTCKN
jgi:rubrerythrin